MMVMVEIMVVVMVDADVEHDGYNGEHDVIMVMVIKLMM